MTLKSLLRKIIYCLADVPIIGIPFLWLLKYRRVVMQRKIDGIELHKKEGEVVFDYYEEALKGMLQCVERHEIRLRELEKKLESKNE